MDLKNFKKVSHNKTHTIFEHPEGHIIHVAHQNLSKDMKKEMKDLPKVEAVQNLAQGGLVSQDEEYLLGSNKSPLEQLRALPMASAPSSSPSPENVIVPQPMQSQALPSMEQPPEGEVVGDSGVGQIRVKPAIQDDPFGSQTFLADTKANEDLLRRGYETDLAAKNKVATGQAKENQKLAKDLEIQQTTLQEAFAEVQGESDAIAQEINSKEIDPNRFIRNMSTGSKVMTALGMLVSGFGAGLSGQKNMAVEFLDKQIDADIDAQKLMKEDQRNLLRHYQQKFGNTQVAGQMLKASMLDIHAAKLQQMALSEAPGINKAAAMQGIAEMQQKSAMIRQQAAQQLGMNRATAMTQQAGDIPTKIEMLRRMGKSEEAKDLQSRYVPGVGEAQVPVSDKAREEMGIRMDLDKALSDLDAFAKKNSGSLNPATIAEGKALASLAIDRFRVANGWGAFTGGEKKFAEDMISLNPTAFLNEYRARPGYAQVIKANKDSLGTLYNRHGIKANVPGKGFTAR